jgi:hypothetical protein
MFRYVRQELRDDGTTADVKINRLKLIKLVKAEINRIDNITEQRNTDIVIKAKLARDEYVASTKGSWVTFANAIITRVSMNTPVTRDDVPQALRDGYRDYVSLWSAPASPALHVPRTQALVTLLDVLEASSDEEVSTSSLQKDGFTLGHVLRRHDQV